MALVRPSSGKRRVVGIVWKSLQAALPGQIGSRHKCRREWGQLGSLQQPGQHGRGDKVWGWVGCWEKLPVLCTQH